MRKITNEELGRPTPEEFARMERMPLTVVLDNVRSAQNVGAFFRTGDAFAVERICLCGITPAPPAREIHKTALGAELTVAWCRERSAAECGRRYALVFGNEVEGVAQEVVDLCDGAVEIPQAGTKHSLNVSVSAGVVLWDFFCRIGPKR